MHDRRRNRFLDHGGKQARGVFESEFPFPSSEPDRACRGSRDDGKAAQSEAVAPADSLDATVGLFSHSAANRELWHRAFDLP